MVNSKLEAVAISQGLKTLKNNGIEPALGVGDEGCMLQELVDNLPPPLHAGGCRNHLLHHMPHYMAAYLDENHFIDLQNVTIPGKFSA